VGVGSPPAVRRVSFEGSLVRRPPTGLTGVNGRR